MNQTLMTAAQIQDEHAVSGSVVANWIYKGKLTAVARSGVRKYYARNQVEKIAAWYNRNGCSVNDMPFVEPRNYEFSPGMLMIDEPTPKEQMKYKGKSGIERKIGHVPTPEDLFKIVETIDKLALKVESIDDAAGVNKSRATGEVKSLAKMAGLLEGVVVAIYGEDYRV